MSLSVFTVILVLGLLMAPLAAEAPPAGKIYRIDYLLHAQDVQGSQDLEDAFARMAQARPEALLILGDSLINMYRPQIATFATQQHLPSVFVTREWVVAGGLMSYRPSRPDLYRLAATYVDKILQGAKPTDLPVEQLRTFEPVINLKTAQALGLTMPQCCSSRRLR
jgi:putative ABC transport system substrate-binding protein